MRAYYIRRIRMALKNGGKDRARAGGKDKARDRDKPPAGADTGAGEDAGEGDEVREDRGLTVAVLRGAAGELIEVPDTKTVELYRKEGGLWALSGTLEFSFTGAIGISLMTQRLQEFAGLMAEAGAVAARGYPGI